MANQEKAQEFNKLLEEASALEIVSYFLKNFKGDIVFSTGLGAEGQVLTDMIVDKDKDKDAVKIVTLDTGRLFQETYDLIDRTRERYDLNINIYFPDYTKVEEMVNEKGMNLFYKSVENRKLCCHIRKIEPLKRATKGYKIWISGLRRNQSITRFHLQPVEWDEANQMIKVHPLYNWTEDDVWNYIKKNKVPYNELHDKGFPSIGCKPCTRAIKPGEDLRAGRWWWEEPEKRECGLHTQNNN